jgi:hypothetical protein
MNIAAANHSIIRRAGHITAVMLTASVLQIRAQSSDTLETMPPELPIPPDYKLAEAAAAKVAASALPPEAKNLIQNQFQEIKSDFTQVWTPIQNAYTQYLENLHAVDFEFENFKALASAHESKKKHYEMPKEASALAAYNKEATDGNTWLANIRQKRAQAGKDYRQSLDENAKILEQWCSTSRQFNKTAQDLLTGKLQFKKGLAWDQLVEAAKSAEAADLVFDGGKNSDPNVVDATGVVPLTPEERQKMQKQPSVQKPRGFRVAPNNEPPPPGR